jgi:hypothetical protein
VSPTVVRRVQELILFGHDEGLDVRHVKKKQHFNPVKPFGFRFFFLKKKKKKKKLHQRISVLTMRTLDGLEQRQTRWQQSISKRQTDRIVAAQLQAERCFAFLPKARAAKIVSAVSEMRKKMSPPELCKQPTQLLLRSFAAFQRRN